MRETRVERDRHFECEPGKPCQAPAPKKLAAGRSLGKCVPRRTWWLRTRNAAGTRVSIGFKSEIEAREAARKVEAARTLGVDYAPPVAADTPPKAPTFAHVAEEALTLHSQLESLRPGTLRCHRKSLKNHLLPAFGALPVTPEHFSQLALRRFIANLRDPQDPTGRRLSDSTITTSLPTLRLTLDHAVELGLLPANPMKTGRRLWKHRAGSEVSPFTCAELRRIVRATREFDQDFAALVQLMAQTGLRPGEALGLRRGDIDLEAGVVHVRGTWSLNDNRRGPTKTAKSVRTVSLCHPVLEDRSVWKPGQAGRETLQVLDRLRVLQAIAPDRESPLFPARITPSQPMDGNAFYARWARVLSAAAVPYKKPHALRHSFASILLSRGANLLYMVRAGGWTNATTLLKVYSKWVEEASDVATIASSGASSTLGSELRQESRRVSEAEKLSA